VVVERSGTVPTQAGFPHPDLLLGKTPRCVSVRDASPSFLGLESWAGAEVTGSSGVPLGASGA
jgi:hypothetical protein